MHGGATGWLSCQGNLPATAARDVRMFTITWEVNAMDILIGILILVLGASVATMGLRLWFWMLPILGFMTGFFLGAIFILGLVGDDWALLLISILGAVLFAFVALMLALPLYRHCKHGHSWRHRCGQRAAAG